MKRTIDQAVILVGGKGTRLGALTAETPKPLLPVAGRPFLDWVVDNLGGQGVREVILTVGYRAEVFSDWRPSFEGELSVRTFVEEEPLGTGGALPLIHDWLDEAFFVVNGDTLLDVPFMGLATLLADTGAQAAVALRHVEDTARYGRVRLESDHVRDFAEKSAPGPGLINGGVYAFRRDVLARLTAPGAPGLPASLESDLLPALAREGQLVGLPCDGFFLDIGLPATYEAAQTSVPAWWASRSGG